MVAVVEPRRRNVIPDVARSGRGVSASTWTDLAALMNFLNGHGVQMAPAACPATALAAAGSATYQFRGQPAYAITRRLWCLGIRGTRGAGDSLITVTAPAGSGTPVTYSVARTREELLPVVYEEARARVLSTATDYSIKVDATHAVVVESIAHVDIPRATLETTGNDGGVEIESVGFRQPIVHDAGKSLEGVADTLTTSGRSTRHHFALAWPADTTGARSFAGAGPTQVLQLPLPILAAKKYPTDIVRPVRVYAYAWCSNGTSAFSIAVSALSGDTDSIAVPLTSTVGAWFGPATLDVACEDLTTSDGMQGGAFDTLTFAVTRTAGAGTLYLASLMGFE